MKRKNKKNRKNSNYNSTALAVANKDTTKKESKETGKTTKFSYYSYKERVNYNYKGTKNKTKYPFFVDMCKFTQDELKLVLPKLLIKEGYDDVVLGDGYIYAKGDIPVLLTAHMDTVHKDPVKDFYEYYDENKNQHIISSPEGIGGDDRCGIYMILNIIKTHKCSVLFCEDEEIGGVGSKKFCKTELVNELTDLNYLIELDRANGTDAVFYNCINYDFIDFIEDNTGYKEAHGSFSDISNLSPACKVASVNLSCGYYNAHTTSEYVIVEEMLNTIETVKKLLDVECKQYEYKEETCFLYGRGYGGLYDGYYSSYYRDYYDKKYDRYFDDNYYSSYYQSKNKTHTEPSSYKNTKDKNEDKYEEKSLLVSIYDENIDEVVTYVSNGITEDDAFGKFFRNNPMYSFYDVYDYEYYDEKVCEDGLVEEY